MSKTERIMVIENDSKDAANILNIIESMDKNYKLLYFASTEEAIENLKKENNLPQLILLVSPQGDGNSIEFLKIIKDDNNLKKIPVVIISTTDEHTHVIEGFNNGAAGYMVKSDDHLELTGIIKTIMHYWNTCELPYV